MDALRLAARTIRAGLCAALCTGLCVAAIVGCAQPYVATPEDETRARTMEPAPGTALITFYRGLATAIPTPSALVFVRPEVPVSSGTSAPDAKRVGLSPGEFAVAEVPAGSVRLTVVSTVSGLAGSDTGSFNMTQKFPAGSKTYIEVRTNLEGLGSPGRADPRLFIRAADVGAEAVGRYKLRGWLRFVPPPTPKS
jgi:hypothetical protein